MGDENYSAEEYDKLKMFLGLYVDWFFPKADLTSRNHPLAVLANIEKNSLAEARRGLKMAVNDIVESSAEWQAEQVAEADARFASHGTYTLSEIRRRYSKRYLQVLKRGAIRSSVEYYLLKGILDGSSIEAGATEAEQIKSLLTAFEAKVMRSVAKK